MMVLCTWCGKPSKWAICRDCRIKNDIALPEPPAGRDEGGVMNWNYRAIKEVCEGETVCRVYEVYYDEEKEITGWTADAIHAQGETLEELRAELIMMLHDVSQLPMLDMEELRKQFPGDEGE